MPNTKKFLDANGVAYLASLLDNYPDNDLLGTVIDAIQDALDNKANITDLEDLPFCKIYIYLNNSLEVGNSFILAKNRYDEDPYPNQYWYGKPRLALVEFHDGDSESYGVFSAIMQSFVLVLKQIDGTKEFRTQHIINNHLSWDGNTVVYYQGESPVIEAETMANVTAMLTGFGLDASTTLTPALAGSAETDSAVVQEGVSP